MSQLPLSWCRPTSNGALLSLRVVPRAARTAIQGLHNGALKIRLAAPPVEGKANDALCRYLSHVIGVSARAIRLTGGATSRVKQVEVSGLSAEIVRARIEAEIAQ